MPEQIRTLTLADGTDVDIEPLKRLDEDTLQVEIDGDHHGRWHLEVTETGDYELLTSWDGDGDLADVGLPEWLDEALELVGVRV